MRMEFLETFHTFFYFFLPNIISRSTLLRLWMRKWWVVLWRRLRGLSVLNPILITSCSWFDFYVFASSSVKSDAIGRGCWSPRGQTIQFIVETENPLVWFDKFGWHFKTFAKHLLQIGQQVFAVKFSELEPKTGSLAKTFEFELSLDLFPKRELCIELSATLFAYRVGWVIVWGPLLWPLKMWKTNVKKKVKLKQTRKVNRETAVNPGLFNVFSKIFNEGSSLNPLY